MAFKPAIMKCFEWLVSKYVKSSLTTTLDSFLYVYSPNHSISTAIHLFLTHLDKKDNDMIMLFIDLSSSFNTTVP